MFCTQALNESRHTFIQGMDGTHTGEYYENGNCNFSNVGCLEKSTRYSIIVLYFIFLVDKDACNRFNIDLFTSGKLDLIFLLSTRAFIQEF